MVITVNSLQEARNLISKYVISHKKEEVQLCSFLLYILDNNKNNPDTFNPPMTIFTGDDFRRSESDFGEPICMSFHTAIGAVNVEMYGDDVWDAPCHVAGGYHVGNLYIVLDFCTTTRHDLKSSFVGI